MALFPLYRVRFHTLLATANFPEAVVDQMPGACPQKRRQCSCLANDYTPREPRLFPERLKPTFLFSSSPLGEES